MTNSHGTATIPADKTYFKESLKKKARDLKDLGQNPPKEEGGGDNLGMSGYKVIQVESG